MHWYLHFSLNPRLQTLDLNHLASRVYLCTKAVVVVLPCATQRNTVTKTAINSASISARRTIGVRVPDGNNLWVLFCWWQFVPHHTSISNVTCLLTNINNLAPLLTTLCHWVWATYQNRDPGSATLARLQQSRSLLFQHHQYQWEMIRIQHGASHNIARICAQSLIMFNHSSIQSHYFAKALIATATVTSASSLAAWRAFVAHLF